MTLVRFKNNPTEAFRDAVIPTFNGLFNSIMNEAESNFKTQFFTPKADILETDENFCIHFSIPGIEKENVSIDLKNNTLTVTGEKAVVKNEENKKYHLIENGYGKFSRSFTLPNNIKRDEIGAEFKNGILELILPKSEDAQPRSIAIK